VSTRLGVDGHVACTTGHYAPRRGQVAGRGPCKLRPHRAGASLRGGHAAPNQGERARAAPPRHNRELGEAGGHGRAGGHHAGEGSGLGWGPGRGGGPPGGGGGGGGGATPRREGPGPRAAAPGVTPGFGR
jgi:hypothetical protein